MEKPVGGAELEATRQQVWQEIEGRWQEELEQNPKLKEEDPEIVYGNVTDDQVDPEVRADYEATWKARKIQDYLYNFPAFLPGRDNQFLELLGPNYVYTDTHTIYSPLLYGKTISQYNTELAEVMEEANISVEDYRKLEEKRDYNHPGITNLELREAQLEIFIRLRARNIAHPDFPTAT